MVYWGNLPTVSIFQSLHYDTGANHKRMKLFCVFCLASQHASPHVRDIFTNIFGGADGNEGLGLLSISLDWQYITSTYMSLPLLQQGLTNSWIGVALCYVILSAIYYSNAWNSQDFPMLSTSIFSSNGSVYDQATVFGTTFQLNQTVLEEVGLPHMTGSNIWAKTTTNLAIGGLFAHCICFWGPYLRETLKNARTGMQPDPHWKAMQKYKEASFWWYICLLIISFISGLIVILKGQTTLSLYSFIVALLLGSFVTPFSQLLFARLGTGISTNQLMKMFTMWSHDIIAQSIALAGDLKIGQYLKIPPRAMFLTQLWGTILGAAINFVVMVSIVKSQRAILLSPNGTNVWSGQLVQSFNSDAVTWSLAKELYGPGGPYFIVPISLLIGMRWSKIGPIKVDNVILPVIYMYSSLLASRVNSTVTSSIIVGIVSQFWLRNYHPSWFRKYNYILGGALDGGAQIMIFILSFAVFGASGTPRPFPPWAGNPAKGNVDYCNGNGALNR
ncbi:hypothetical protein ID866_10578 [Astraeus odoratus]|nr:hypothetical protein ID866_10578 [Astraeus odoratus]